jgi:hypothetical protein
LLIAAPRWKDEIRPLDLHSQLEFLWYWKCRSTVHWQVIGPPELLDDLKALMAAINCLELWRGP